MIYTKHLLEIEKTIYTISYFQYHFLSIKGVHFDG